MDQKAGAQISQRAFIQSLAILFLLMMIAGILTLVVPAGQYTQVEVDGRETIDPASFQFIERHDGVRSNLFAKDRRLFRRKKAVSQ
jgi:uncharacterized ion transporter superfamily protein YfcC